MKFYKVTTGIKLFYLLRIIRSSDTCVSTTAVIGFEDGAQVEDRGFFSGLMLQVVGKVVVFIV